MRIKLFHRLARNFWSLSSTSLILIAGAIGECCLARSSLGAEAIRFTVSGPLTVSISLDSLATFAETGAITGDLKLFTGLFDEKAMAVLRQGLQRRMTFDLVQTYKLTYSPLGREALKQVGKVVRFTPSRNGFYGLRAALLGAAADADAEGWTLLDAIEQFPTQTIEVDVQDLLNLRQQLSAYLDYAQAAVAAIEARAQTEADSQQGVDVKHFSDLSQPGGYDIKRETLTVTNPALRETSVGLSVNYDFSVDVYIPQRLRQPAPIVIVSHGFGAVKENFVFIAEHLASHGFVVFVPDHVGSDLSFRQTYLEGNLNTLLSPIEFINRPQEISFLIDHLESITASDRKWTQWLNLEQIGVMGNSLGGTTALSLAGAEIDHARIEKTCAPEEIVWNFSLYLQCRAQFLPPENIDLDDPRIRATIAAHPLASGIFGPEGMSKIDSPLLMTAGSQDLVAPVVTEQIHPFVWMPSQPKYLALFNPGTHFATSKQSAEGSQSIPAFLKGNHQEVGRQYFKILSVAFFESYLRDRHEFLPYLSAAYAHSISQGKPMKLNIIQSLTPEELEVAHGKTPPLPIVPIPVESAIAERRESILSQIQRTGVLKLAMRRDVPPFGYLDRQQQWTGYCPDLAIALQAHLAQKLGLDLGVELAELPSTLKNRFSLVQDDAVHLECGPNTIRQDIEGVTFSNPIWATGTRFLSQRTRQADVNQNPSLAGLKVGVLKNTTTEQFLQTNYPQAEVVYFKGAQGRTDAIKAVTDGRIDAFASDSLLSLAEVEQQNLRQDHYTLHPKLPLTCDFYGLILPNDDSQWRTTINQFLLAPAAQQVREKWFHQRFSSPVSDLEYCLNR